MKKALLFLSAMVFASGIYAADKLIPGTKESPNYYVIKAGRGMPFLAYSDENLNVRNEIYTQLHRTSDLSEANIWAVTQGTSEGTIHITTYGNSNKGIMTFINNEGASCSFGSVATVSTPKDIFPIYNEDGTYSLCINNSKGYGYEDESSTEYYTLDATNNSDFCGNWRPNDTGSKWSVYMLDLTGGTEAALTNVVDAIEYDDVRVLLEDKVAKLEPYVDAVPGIIANILTAAINQIKSLSYSYVNAEKAEKIVTSALADANEVLATGMNGMQLSLKNLRQNKFISIKDNKWVYTSNNENPETVFTFIAQPDGGYILYNESNNIYVGQPEPDDEWPGYTNIRVTKLRAYALTVYPLLYTDNTTKYHGIAMPLEANPTEDTKAINANNRSQILHSYEVNDAGSIFALSPSLAVIKSFRDEKINKLNLLIENIPWIVDELQMGIDTLNHLAIDSNTDYETLIAQINEIWDNCITAANKVLDSTILNGKTFAIKNLRRSAIGKAPYVAIENDNYTNVTSFVKDNACFTFVSEANGGYYIYNASTKTYISTDCTPTSEIADALIIYPILHDYGSYTGFVFPMSAERTGQGLNVPTSNDATICLWTINDEGSMWALIEVSNDSRTKDFIELNLPKIEPYVDAVPDMISNILTTAINRIKTLTYSETFATDVENIINAALHNANETLATGLNGMQFSLKNLRMEKFIGNNDNEWVYFDNEIPETAFTFKSQDSGGYILHNELNNIYIGQPEQDEENPIQTNVAITMEESTALTVYPFLCKGGNYSGVAMALEANPTESTAALNTNKNIKILHTYNVHDAGSIFALVPFDIHHQPIKGVKLTGIVGLVGESIEINAEIESAYETDQTINWSSSNSMVASVDSEGKVWFNASGNAIVSAECQGYEISVPFIVKEVVANSLNVFPAEAVGGIGHEFSLLALHEPDNTTDKSVIWESSNPEVATVNEDGRVSLASNGSAKITARSGVHTAVCNVIVDNTTTGLTEMATTGIVIDITSDGIIVRNAAEGESIAVYTVDGKVVNGAIIESEETHLKLAAGIYIVKVSPATVAKVLIH